MAQPDAQHGNVWAARNDRGSGGRAGITKMLLESDATLVGANTTIDSIESLEQGNNAS